jgi:hypothetical protein
MSPGNIRKSRRRKHIAGWAALHEFLSIEIADPGMRIAPGSADSFQVFDSEGNPVSLPITASARQLV